MIELHYALLAEARAVLPGEGFDAVHAVGPDTEVAIGPAARKVPPPAPAPPRTGGGVSPPG